MKKFEDAIKKVLKKYVSEVSLEIPPDTKLGDYAFPCFVLAKSLKKNPVEIAKKIASEVKVDGLIKEVKAIGPYVNFFVDKSLVSGEVLDRVYKEKEKYGSDKQGRTYVIDFSHPNIAKPFGIGHLRSTVIGNSFYKMLTFLGNKVIRVNHLGDWGTQFGKLIVAYNKWGKEKELQKEPIKYLLKLYVKFHSEAEKDASLEDEARAAFKKLEDGDKESLALWECFRQLSLKEFQRLYKVLKVEFDSYHGEAFFNPVMQKTIAEVKKKAKAEISEGALVVPMEDDMPPAIVQKSDGASTYLTRDIAAGIYRLKEYKPDKVIYVVGAEQSLHFKQFFKVLSLMGYDSSKFLHIPFGLFKFPEGKMSTRKGNVIFLEEVLDKLIDLAKETIENKNPSLKNKDEVAKVVGIGALIFEDLSNDRVRDIDFDWNRILDFEGETAPYIQYSYVRICSILNNVSEVKGKVNSSLLESPYEIKLIELLSKFGDVVKESMAKYKPHILARYLLDLAQSFNEFYHNCPVKQEEGDLQKARVRLIECVKIVLKNGLSLLGIDVVDKM